MLEREGLLLADDLVQAGAGVEAGLDVGEGHDGAVRASTTAHHRSGQLYRTRKQRTTYPNLPSRKSLGEKPMASWKVNCIGG